MRCGVETLRYLRAGPPEQGSPNIVVVDDILSDAVSVDRQVGAAAAAARR
eukprot:COSAG06_NODE_42453_length_381_cov_1.418440_1_plen_49_part_01